MTESPTAGLAAGDYACPIGAAGEGAGYVLSPDRLETISFGNAAFFVGLHDWWVANAIIIAHHYSRRIYSASTPHLGIWIDGVLVGVLQSGFAMNSASVDSVVTGALMTKYLELNRM